MTITRTLIATIVTLTGLAVSTGNATAASYRHIDSLARKMMRQSRQLKSEFAFHYRHVSEYRHLIHDANELYRIADHVHDVAHHSGNPYHLRNDLAKLDRLFHHVEGLVHRIEFRARRGRNGHIHGSTNHVDHLIANLEDTLHHLQADVEEMVAYRPHRHHGRTVYYGGHRGRGIQAIAIQADNFAFHLAR